MDKTIDVGICTPARRKTESFAELGAKSEPGFFALIFTVILVVIAISGSLWVMYNMNANMMPRMTMETGSGGM